MVTIETSLSICSQLVCYPFCDNVPQDPTVNYLACVGNAV